jgi:hypothetical protein
MLKIIRKLLIAALILTGSFASAQEIFTLETGVHGGGSYFNGDFKPLTGAIQQDFGITVRRMFNQRLSLMADYHRVTLNATGVQPFKALFSENVTLNQQFNILDAMLVMNFLDYGKLDNILKSSDYSPYLTGGLGLISENMRFGKNTVYVSIPLGMGCKIKIANRLHFNVQWVHRLIINADGLEGTADLDNKLGLNGTNIFNSDQIGTFTVGISYSLLKKDCKCMHYK